jgi:hypothetical protein
MTPNQPLGDNTSARKIRPIIVPNMTLPPMITGIDCTAGTPIPLTIKLMISAVPLIWRVAMIIDDK